MNLTQPANEYKNAQAFTTTVSAMYKRSSTLPIELVTVPVQYFATEETEEGFIAWPIDREVALVSELRNLKAILLDAHDYACVYLTPAQTRLTRKDWLSITGLDFFEQASHINVIKGY